MITLLHKDLMKYQVREARNKQLMEIPWTTDQANEVSQVNEEKNMEDKYELFRNMSVQKYDFKKCLGTQLCFN